MDTITMQLENIPTHLIAELLKYLGTVNAQMQPCANDPHKLNILNNMETVLALIHFIKNFDIPEIFYIDNMACLQAIAMRWDKVSSHLKFALYHKKIPQLNALLIITGIDPVPDVEHIKRSLGE